MACNLSVCLSVTHRYCVETAKHVIIFSLSYSGKILAMLTKVQQGHAKLSDKYTDM